MNMELLQDIIKIYLHKVKLLQINFIDLEDLYKITIKFQRGVVGRLQLWVNELTELIKL